MTAKSRLTWSFLSFCCITSPSYGLTETLLREGSVSPSCEGLVSFRRAGGGGVGWAGGGGVGWAGGGGVGWAGGGGVGRAGGGGVGRGQPYLQSQIF